MGILTRYILGAPERRMSIESPLVPLDSGWAMLAAALGGGPASSGVIVSRESSMGYAPWRRAIQLVSEGVARLPFLVYRRTGPKMKEIDPRHPAWKLLKHKPNDLMTRFIWQRLVMIDVMTAGNHYSWVRRDGAARPMELVPLRPELTWPVRELLRDGGARLWYISQLNPEQGSYDLLKFRPEDVIHVRNLGFTGLLGMSVIAQARETLGLGMGAHQFHEIFFRNAGTMSVALEVPVTMPERAIQNLQQSWERAHSGISNAHRVAILRDGVKVSPYRVNANDAATISTHEFSVKEVSDYTGAPLHKLGIGSSAGGMEEANQQFLDDCLDPHLTNIAEELTDKLLTEEEKTRGSHDIDVNRRQLLRVSITALTDHCIRMLQFGVMSPNEVRHTFGENPRPDGDIFYPPPNMAKMQDGSELFWSPDGASPPAPGTVPSNAPGADGDAKPAPMPMPAPAPGSRLIPLPPVRQETPSDCGAAVVRSVCKHFGAGLEDDTQEAYITALGTTTEAGTPPQAIIDFLVKQGLSVTAAAEMTIADLDAAWRRGMPVICCIQDWGTPAEMRELESGHWVAVVGVAFGYVFVMDPSQDNAVAGDEPPTEPLSVAAPSLTMIPAVDFEGAWWRDKDGDGRTYERFGIAVGKEVELPSAVSVAAPVDSEAEEGAEDTETSEPGTESNEPTGQQPATAGTPTSSTDDALAQQGDLQQAALNGAQVTALLDIVNQAATGQLPLAAAKLIIQAAFPLLPPEQVNALVQSLEGFTPAPEPGTQAAESAATEPNADSPEDTEETEEVEEPEEPQQDGEEKDERSRRRGVFLRRLRTAHRDLLTEAVRRMVHLLGDRTKRRAQKPAEFTDWLCVFVSDHRSILLDALSPAIRAAGILRADPPDASDVVDDLLCDMKGQLDSLVDRETRTTLAVAVDALTARWEAEIPGRIADRLTGIRAKPDEPERDTDAALSLLAGLPDADDEGRVAVTMPVGTPPEVTPEQLKGAKEEVVKLRKLIATRGLVKRSRVEDFVRDADTEPSEENVEGLPKDLPYVVRHGGELYLYDGHHRSMAKQLLGVAKCRAYVVEVE